MDFENAYWNLAGIVILVMGIFMVVIFQDWIGAITCILGLGILFTDHFKAWLEEEPEE